MSIPYLVFCLLLLFSSAAIVETAGQQIVRELTEKYMNHLNQELSKTKEEYM